MKPRVGINPLSLRQRQHHRCLLSCDTGRPLYRFLIGSFDVNVLLIPTVESYQSNPSRCIGHRQNEKSLVLESGPGHNAESWKAKECWALKYAADVGEKTLGNKLSPRERLQVHAGRGWTPSEQHSRGVCHEFALEENKGFCASLTTSVLLFSGEE